MLKRTGIALLIMVALSLAFFLIISPGKTSAILDIKGKVIPSSIAVIEKPGMGGINQGIVITG